MTLPERSALNMCFILDQVLPTDESVEHKKSHRQSHRKKVLPEIYLTRLLSTKVGDGTPSFMAGGIIVCGLWQEAYSSKGALQGQLLLRGSGTLLSWTAGTCLARLAGTTSSLGSLQLSSSPSEQQCCCVKPHTISLGWSGVCAHERDVDHLRAHDAQFRAEPISPVRDPAGKGNEDAQLWEQGECLCNLNSDLNFPTPRVLSSSSWAPSPSLIPA